MNKSKPYFKIFFICFLIFIGAGILNIHGYQKRVISECMVVLNKHFESKGENVLQFIEPDYSLGQIEIGVETNSGKYYVVLGDATPLYIQHTALNFVLTPKVSIQAIQNDT